MIGGQFAQLAMVGTGLWMATVGATGWIYLQQDAMVPDPESRKVSDEREWIVENTVPTHVSIPALDIQTEVIPGQVIDNEWEVSEEQANYLVGSGLLGRPGNAVIYAHKRPQLFGNLSKVKIGDEVLISSRDAVAIYKVVEAYETTGDNVSVLEDSMLPEVTLYTCNRWNDSHRFVVKARLSKKYANGLGGLVAAAEVDHAIEAEE